jgi:hypothetical protein
MGAIDERVLGIQSGKILEISFKSFPQGFQIHVVFKARVKPTHGNEHLLGSVNLFDLWGIAGCEKRQDEHNGQDEGSIFA